MVESIGGINILFAAAIMGFAGFTKGAIGFGLPMIVVSGVGSFLSAELAIAAIIIPGFVTNLWQSLRNGQREAVASLAQYWRLNVVLVVVIFLSAGLAVSTPENILFMTLGCGIILFGGLQLSGWVPEMNPEHRTLTEVIVGVVAGFFGGLAGVWGPPILLYLIALGIPKTEIIRVQGISFLLGSIVLIFAHTGSGILNETTIWFSVLLVIPAVLGMVLGVVVQAKINQEAFRKLTLVVLIFAGINLLRRAVF